MKYKGRRITPEEFGEIVIRSTDDGQVLKLKDIATIELGQESYAYSGTTDGHNGISCMLFQTAGSNATEVNNQINRFLEEARKELPQGVELTTTDVVQRLPVCLHPRSGEDTVGAILLVILVVVCLFAGYPLDTDSTGGDHCITYRYVRFHGDSRIQYQPADPVCASARYRYGGG